MQCFNKTVGMLKKPDGKVIKLLTPNYNGTFDGIFKEASQDKMINELLRIF